MNRLTKTAVAVLAGLATVATPLAQANAGDWDGRHWRKRPVVHHQHHRNDDALAAGLIGLAAGAIIIGALSQPKPAPVYHAYPPVNAYPPAPRNAYQVEYAGDIEPWSREWYRFCSDRYQSFNAETGTYRGYDGRNHFCVAN